MNRDGVAKPVSHGQSVSALLLGFLGSMNLAITLLVAVGIASIVGTVLKQNEAFQNYIVKFGPFWFEVFDTLGLYDVYSAAWFLLILTFLVISTSTCIYRNAPSMLRDMRSHRLDVHYNSLNAFHNRHSWQLVAPVDAIIARFTPVVASRGYTLRSKDHGDHIVVSAKKGTINRLGYLFTHSAIVIICIGGLLDGNLPLKWKAYSGDIRIETRDIPASQVPEVSRLPVGNPSFRGSVNVPEGSSANLVFLNLRDGYLVQPLPFNIEVKDFRIEHYSTGQPKSFESDLVIHDPERAEPLEQTIAVNHPLIYKGYAIYQASFSDGGSKLDLRLWPLVGRDATPQSVRGAVFEDIDVETSIGRLTLELTNFRLFNINPVQENPNDEKELRNFGPNISFKLRNELGEAVEFENYMSPVELKGRPYYLSGVRKTVAEPFQYLYIPVDPQNSVERFMQFNARLHDQERVGRIARRTAEDSASVLDNGGEAMVENLQQSMQDLVALFVTRGVDGVMQQVESSVPEAEQANVMDAYMKVLQTLLAGVYAELLTESGVDLSQGISAQDARFFEDAITAVTALGNYGAPVFVQLESFRHIQSTGLQIARAPGKTMVYVGFALLIAGVFFMFYVTANRLWFWIDTNGSHCRVLLAGSGLRHQRDFENEFAVLRDEVDAEFGKLQQ
jgi:cytochrome c biogenesis protein